MASSIDNTLPKKYLTKRPFNYKLEFLRGVAALLVIYYHAIVHKFTLDPAYMPGGVWKFIAPGHLAVLVFFVLSGYVIQLTNATPVLGSKVKAYLQKRFVRIYPIYAAATLFTWLAFLPKYAVKVLIFNLLFLQIFKFAPIMWENNPVWSLDYEVGFYLLFIVLSGFKFNTKAIALSAFVMSFALVFLVGHEAISELVPYLVYLCFWVCGAIIAQTCAEADFTKMNPALLVSSVFAFASLEYFNILHTVLNRMFALLKPYSVLSNTDWGLNTDMIRDFSLLPFCLIIILLFAGVKKWYTIYGYYLLQAINALTLIHVFQSRHQPSIDIFLIPGICFALSVILIFCQKNQKINWLLEEFMRKGAGVGSISYGIYIVHFPILSLFQKMTLCSGTGIDFLGRFVLFVALTLAAAYFLEKKLQPFAVRFLTGK